MIFFKKSLITITILVIAIWVMPSTSETSYLQKAIEMCKEILKDSFCSFKNTSADFEGTVRDKFDQLEKPYLLKGYLETRICTIPNNWGDDITSQLSSEMPLLLKNQALKYLNYLSENIISKDENHYLPVDTYCKNTITANNFKNFVNELIIKKFDENQLNTILDSTVENLKSNLIKNDMKWDQ